MPFDPCGTRQLDGEDLIKRLAAYLGVPPNALFLALKEATRRYKDIS